MFHVFLISEIIHPMYLPICSKLQFSLFYNNVFIFILMISFLRSIILQLLFIQKFQHFIWSVYSVVECFCNNCSIHSKICFQFSNYHLAVLLFSLLVLFNSLVLNISFKNLTFKNFGFIQKCYIHSKNLFSFENFIFI